MSNPFADPDGEYIELVGEDLPNHLRFDISAMKAQCPVCQRWTWSMGEFGRACRFPQPDGALCPGEFPDPRGSADA